MYVYTLDLFVMDGFKRNIPPLKFELPRLSCGWRRFVSCHQICFENVSLFFIGCFFFFNFKFSCRSLLNTLSFPGLQVDGRLIPASLTVRSLGVYLDSSLTMETRRMVVKSLGISQFSYCASLLAGINAKFVSSCCRHV